MIFQDMMAVHCTVHYPSKYTEIYVGTINMRGPQTILTLQMGRNTQYREISSSLTITSKSHAKEVPHFSPIPPSPTDLLFSLIIKQNAELQNCLYKLADDFGKLNLHQVKEKKNTTDSLLGIGTLVEKIFNRFRAIEGMLIEVNQMRDEFNKKNLWKKQEKIQFNF